MGQYSVHSGSSKKFTLIVDNKQVGELLYKKWHSFDADILLNNGQKYQLESKGFWDSKIELKQGNEVLLDYKMGWKGIIVKHYFGRKEKRFLLKQKGFPADKFVLLDEDKEQYVIVESEFKRRKFNYDYRIETTRRFDSFDNQDLLLLTLLHSIKYYTSYLIILVLIVIMLITGVL